MGCLDESRPMAEELNTSCKGDCRACLGPGSMRSGYLSSLRNLGGIAFSIFIRSAISGGLKLTQNLACAVSYFQRSL